MLHVAVECHGDSAGGKKKAKTLVEGKRDQTDPVTLLSWHRRVVTSRI